MAEKNTVVYGIYANKRHLEEVISRLLAEGFREEDISVLAAGARQGTAPGAGAGRAIGDTLGLLADIGAGVIRGISPLIETVGGLVGSLIGMGVPQTEASLYEERLKQGGMFVSVRSHGSGLETRARFLMQQAGAEDIGTAEDTRSRTAGSGGSRID